MGKAKTFLEYFSRVILTVFYSFLIVVFLQMVFSLGVYLRYDPATVIEDAALQEYNYLKLQLDRPCTKKMSETDGMADFQSSEWPVMTLSLFCYGARNLAQAYPELKPEIVSYMRKAIERVMTPEYHHFIVKHYGNPFEQAEIKDNAFYLGHLVMMLACYREVAEDDCFDDYFHKFAKGFFDNYMNTPTKCLTSYSNLAWTSEQVVPLRALYIHDKVFKSGYSRAVYEWEDVMKDRFMQKGLLVTAVNRDTGEIYQGPRTIPNVWTILFLHDVLPQFCRELYSNTREHFLIKRMDFPLFKEFLGKKQYATGDTGPILFGAATTSTAFAMGCAGVYGDSKVFMPICLLADCFGASVRYSGKKHFLIGGDIGTAGLFLCHSMMLVGPPAKEKLTPFQFFFLYLIVFIPLAVLIYRVYSLWRKKGDL